jgi:hypothetical protein
METFVRPLTWADLPESFHPTLKALRSHEGEELVLEQNMFIEQMLPSVTKRCAMLGIFVGEILGNQLQTNVFSQLTYALLILIGVLFVV